MSTYEDNILEAITLVVDNAVSTADFDKTIQCVISRVVDSTIGEYVASYQNSTFYVYSTDVDSTYSKGVSVYVLVPGNNMSNKKTIIGTVDKLGSDYIDIVEGEKNYELVGNNVVGEHPEFGLCSYDENTSNEGYLVYSKEKGINEINLDEWAATFYVQNAEAIQLGATFRTSLSNEQKFKGDYGIVYELDFHSNVDDSVITRTYLFNIDMMSGSPYSYTTATRQYGIYDVDNINFIEIKSISIYQKDFPVTKEGMPNDIFITNMEIGGLVALDASDATTCALTLITKRGIYFDETDLPTDYRTLEAEVRVKGVAINTDSQKLDYYWFIENGEVNFASSLYNKLGGAGWACLNESTSIVIDDLTGEVGINWVASDHNYITTKADNPAASTKYKCVAVYSEDMILSREVTIYNFDSDYDAVITSDIGTNFYFDVGRPTLECNIYDKAGNVYNSNEYRFVWHKIDNNNTFYSIDETTIINEEYQALLVEYTQLKLQIQAGILIEEIVAAEKAQLEDKIASYENITRVKDNFIYKLNVAEITSFTNYKCSIYKDDAAGSALLGTASIVITNALSADGLSYRLVINDGDVIFKYNEAGTAPTNGSMEDPQLIQPLTFTLFDDNGFEIDSAAIDLKEARWVVPTTDTLLKVGTENGNPTEEDDINSTATYTGYSTLYYEIANTYNAANTNNNIYLYLTYKDKVVAAKTNFVLLKEGNSGTNGTGLVAKILPAVASGVTVPAFPHLTHNITSADKTSYELNFEPREGENPSKKWFRVELWENGEQIFAGQETNTSAQVELEWSVLANKYEYNVSDSSYFTIDSQTGSIEFKYDEDIEYPNCIIQCKVTYKELDLYTTIPISVAIMGHSNYGASLIDYTGFREVVYSTDGTLPAYDTDEPFKLKITENINGTVADVSLLTSEYQVDYNWSILGQVYMSDWIENFNIEKKTVYSVEAQPRNVAYFKPKDTFNGYCVNNGVKCELTRTDSNNLVHFYGIIYIPIQLYLNRYGQSSLNDWNGNSISINEEDGLILAPQVGAGYKEEDNSFTGVLMGSIKESGKSEIETGLFGYYAGSRTIALDSNTGSAAFGVAGAGQIIIKPSENEAIITSGNYVEKDDFNEGSGLEINLSEPSIKFGSGNFSVDKDGSVTATEYTTSQDFNKYLGSTVVSTTVLYGISVDPDTYPTSANWYIDGTGIDLKEGQYLWQKTRELYGNGQIIESEPIRVTAIVDNILSVTQEYLLHPVIEETLETLDDDPDAKEAFSITENIEVNGETYTVIIDFSSIADEENRTAIITSKIRVNGVQPYPEEEPFMISFGDKVIFNYPNYSYVYNSDLEVDVKTISNPIILGEQQESTFTASYEDDGTLSGTITVDIAGKTLTTTEWILLNIEGRFFDSTSLNTLSGWKEYRLAWKENYNLWIRTKTIWASQPTIPEYSVPYKDLEVESLQDQINSVANDILNELGEEGCVRIADDKIFILDRPEVESAKNVVVMSDEGILFTDTGIKWDSEKMQYTTDSATATWSIGGELNAQSANLGSVTSDICDTGELKLRQMNLTDEKDSVTSGRLRVFDGNSAEISALDASSFHYNQSGGGQVKITPEYGLQVTGNGSQKIYGNITNGVEEGLEATTILVNDEIIFDNIVTTVNVESSSYTGIGFCAYTQ